MAAVFVDTNVLLYAASNLPAEEAKSAMARRIVTEENLCLSAQVLQEFYWVAAE
jgi:predicted nucleic acid-binding protein